MTFFKTKKGYWITTILIFIFLILLNRFVPYADRISKLAFGDKLVKGWHLVLINFSVRLGKRLIFGFMGIVLLLYNIDETKNMDSKEIKWYDYISPIITIIVSLILLILFIWIVTLVFIVLHVITSLFVKLIVCLIFIILFSGDKSR